MVGQLLLLGTGNEHLGAHDHELLQSNRPELPPVDVGPQVLANFFQVPDRGAHGHDLEVRGAVKDLVQRHLQRGAALGLAEHVHLVDDDQAELVEPVVLDEVVDDAARLLNRRDVDGVAHAARDGRDGTLAPGVLFDEEVEGDAKRCQGTHLNTKIQKDTVFFFHEQAIDWPWFVHRNSQK